MLTFRTGLVPKSTKLIPNSVQQLLNVQEAAIPLPPAHNNEKILARLLRD